MTFIVPRLSMTSSHKTTSIDLQCNHKMMWSSSTTFFWEGATLSFQSSTLWNFYYFLQRSLYSISCWNLLYGISTTEEVLLSPAEVYSMESQLLRKFYYLLLKSTLWSFYYLLLRKFYCLLPHKPQWSRNPYSLLRRSNKKKMVQHFCFSSHSWSVKLDVRSNFIYNPDLYNYVIIYIMKISSTLFLYKEVFLSALDMPRGRPSSPTSRPAPNCQYSPDSLCHCIPYFIF